MNTQLCASTPSAEAQTGMLRLAGGTRRRDYAHISGDECGGRSRKNYEIAPEELFRLMREIRAAGLELMGIYHSHPNGNNEPSPRDIERAYYPDVAYFILSPHANRPQPVRAFSIREGRAIEMEIQVCSAEFR